MCMQLYNVTCTEFMLRAQYKQRFNNMMSQLWLITSTARLRLNIFITLKLSRFNCIFCLHLFLLYFLLLVTAWYPLTRQNGVRYKRKMLVFTIVLCTSTDIVKQVIENLHTHVQVGWKILLAQRKKYMHLCKCACVKSSTDWSAAERPN